MSVLPPESTIQGDRLQVNGRNVNAPWQQWQTPQGLRLGISETALIDALGGQLLNSDRPTAQPLHWFTPANQQFNLPTRLSSTTRYLDIQPLVQQFGWQTAIAGSTLQLTTPPTQIMGVRQSRQPWGDRLVVELSQPAPWQTISSSQSVQVVVDAAIDPVTLRRFQARPGQFLATAQLQPGTNGTPQTRLTLKWTGRTAARVWSLTDPHRIVIDLRPDALVEQNIQWAPGLRWRQQIHTVGAQSIPTVWLEVNLQQAGLRMQPILPNPTMVAGIASLLQTARQTQVAAAINGGFFNRLRQLPLGAVRVQNRWVSGPILDRGAIAWDDQGNTRFGRLTLRETVVTATGQRLPLTHLNSGFLQAGIARYTADWGSTYTTLSDGEVVVTVQGDRVASLQPLEKAGGTVAIPANGYLLVLRSNRAAASQFPVGASVQLEQMTEPAAFMQYPYVLGAGPLLLQNQRIVLDARAEGFSPAFVREAAPRSAIAQRADGTILLVTAHRRVDGSSLQLSDMAQLLQHMGAVHALNLDGGSSTTLYLGGRLLDRSPATAARVHNAIGIFLQPNP